MTPEQHVRAKEIFLAVCELPPERREAYLAEACGNDQPLRQHVEQLLNYHSQSDETLPAAGLDETQPSASRPAPETRTERVLDPGTVIAKRYRIVSILGKGGMGEVYRADDLLLGETVALKFLRRTMAGNKEWSDRFTREVHTARSVTHPNICRVHDIHIDEETGETFISMAYIDGEDLRTLLRRFGRLPQQKAIEFSRQLCEGLMAAHAHGILHRDLKPANVMIDGQGRLCITDFGLASTREKIAHNEIRAGTPAYMAPELFAGTDVSAKSDIYALGLLIFEIFSGEPTFSGDSFEQIAYAHQRLAPPSITQIAPDTPPAVERVINACLEKDPNLRPASALTVAAALPGSDILRLAQSAGVTPSPTLVAAAGQQRAILNARTMVLLALLPIYLFLFALIAGYVDLQIATKDTKPTAVLLEDARDLVETLTGKKHQRYEAFGLISNSSPNFIFPMDEDPNASMNDWMLPGEKMRFWYRTCSIPLVPQKAINVTFGRSRTTLRDPPREHPGSLTLVLNDQGELRGWEQVPPHASQPAGKADYDWTTFLGAAGFADLELDPTEPSLNPSVHHDRRQAWQTPANTDAARRILAASDAGKPVWFLVGGRAHENAEDAVSRRYVAISAIMTVLCLAALGAIPLAWINISSGRSDLRGATKLALFVAGVRFMGWILLSSHAPTIVQELQLLLYTMLRITFEAGLVWLFYSALEPYTRRYWPETVVAWNRLLKGGFGDPLVGRDILIGTVLGTGVAVIALLDPLLPTALGIQPREMLRLTYFLEPLLGAREGVSILLHNSLGSLYLGLLVLVLLVIARIVTRYTWISVLVIVVVLFMMFLPRAAYPLTSWLPLGMIFFLVLGSATRFGLLVLLVSVMVSRLLLGMPINFTPGAVGWDVAVLVYLIILGLAIYGFLNARRTSANADDTTAALDTSFFEHAR